MSRRCIIRPAAQAEVDQQADYLAEHASESIAYRFLDAVEETIAELLETPELGSPWVSADARLRGIRRRRVAGFPNHSVFYRFGDDFLEVIHLYHGHQNIDSRLGDRPEGSDRP